MRNENTTQNLIEFAEKIGSLEQAIKDLSKHFTNHLSHHRRTNWFVLIQTLIIAILFMCLKLG